MHLVVEVLPELAFAQRGVLDGLEGLANPRTFPGLLSSRYFYRRLLGVPGGSSSRLRSSTSPDRRLR